jgi:sugar lactone lactonase YvrE
MMKRSLFLVAVLAAGGMLAAGGCMKESQLLVALPEYVNTPDGMSLQPDGSIILSVPNFNDKKSPSVMMRITPDNKAELWYTLPVAQGPLGRIFPMGVSRAPNGDLYLADMQYMEDKDQKSRLWRITVKDGKPTGIVLVAKGFNVANGTIIHDGYVYITESVLEEESQPLTSAVMRFRLDEANVQLATPLKNDPHIIATFKSAKKDWRFGADGLAFDSKGNLFVGLFGEGEMYKITFDKDGKVASNTLFAKAPCLITCDGMSCDLKTDKLYVADSAANAIQVISPDGSVRTLAKNGDLRDKRMGKLDQPCEALLRGNTIVASNMDWPFPGFVNTKWEMPATLSVIKLDGK